MPLYEYKCDICGNVFDAVRPVGAFHATCPACKWVADRSTRPTMANFKINGYNEANGYSRKEGNA